jgi:branched-chain amino acid transport system ATP-binding protein
MLEIRKLNFSYGDLKVLWDVNLDVNKGEIVTVVGPNGAGKSTLLRNISRLVRPASGSIRFEDVELGASPPHRVVEMGVIHVPEARHIFPEMTVIENLRMGSYAKTARHDRPKNLERVFALFPRLAERKGQLGGTMSGGEQQMLAIARGLMGNPRLMLFDEPSLGLAPLLVRDIFAIIREINAQGTTILLLEQNVYQSLRIAHRGYVMETGRVVMTGTGTELLENDHVKQAFLGM